MTDEFDALQAAHQDLLASLEKGAESEDLLPSVEAAIEAMKTGAAEIANSRDREQLRAILRFWAAYIYDQTGTYPDTTLRPADRSRDKAPAESPPSPPGTGMEPTRDVTPPPQPSRETSAGCLGRSFLVVAGIAGLIVVVIVIVGIIFVGGLSAGAAQPTAEVTLPSGTLSPTQAPLSTPTETNSEQGGSINRWVPSVEAAPHPQGCAAREVLVTLDSQDQLDEEQVLALTLQMLQAGTGTLAAAGSPFPGEPPGLIFDLGGEDTGADAGYLLHLEDPSLSAVDVILQFAADCSRNQVQVEYVLMEHTLEAGAEPKINPELSLNWELLTWGPAPNEETWVATVRLQAQDGEGDYVFWADGAPLPEERLILQALPCQPARALVGVTSGGQSAQRELTLLSPFCP